MKKHGSPLAMGVTPGKASTARNASPNAPGSWRTWLPPTVVWVGSGRRPWTVTSVTAGSVVVSADEGGAGESARATPEAAARTAATVTTTQTCLQGAIDDSTAGPGPAFPDPACPWW